MWPILAVVGLTELLRAAARSTAERRDREGRERVRQQAEAALSLARLRHERRVRETTAALEQAHMASADPRWVRELDRIAGKK